MANGISYKIVGADILSKKLKTLVGIPRLIMIPTVAKYALQIMSDARRASPVDLGDLRRSILTSPIADGLTVIIGSALPQAVWVEEGTRPHFPPPAALAGWAARHGMAPGAEWGIARKIALVGTKPTPFLEPAFIENATKFVAEATAQMGLAIDGVVRS